MAKRYFEALRRTFDRDCEVLTVTDSQGKAVSSVLSFYFRDEVLPYYAGDVEAARDLAANDFKYWELLRRACERGLCVFDFGRSKQGTGAFCLQEELGTGTDAVGVRILPLPPRTHPGKQPPQPEVPDAHGNLEETADPGGEPRGSASGQRPGLTKMETLLFLSHRLPYPPNKGDKVRSYHLLTAPGAALSGSFWGPSSTIRPTGSMWTSCDGCVAKCTSSLSFRDSGVCAVRWRCSRVRR